MENYTLPTRKKTRTLEFIHWVNERTEFSNREAIEHFKEGWKGASVSSMIHILKMCGYVSSGERRGDYVVNKICPDDADLSRGTNEFNRMF